MAPKTDLAPVPDRRTLFLGFAEPQFRDADLMAIVSNYSTGLSTSVNQFAEENRPGG